MNKIETDSVNTIPESICLPAGRVGHAYRIRVDEYFFPKFGPSEFRFDGLEEMGLHYVPEKKQITGIPTMDGNFRIHMNINDKIDPKSVSTFTLTLQVENDFVISLEDMPSDENDPYWKPDEAAAIRIVPTASRRKGQNKSMAAASKRGRLHSQNGKFREDDFIIKYNPENEWYILAVSDGSGSAEYSRKGSQIACESAAESCFEQLTEKSSSLDIIAEKFGKDSKETIRGKIAEILHDIIASSVVKAYRDIETEAKKRSACIDNYATTLLLSICKRFNFGWVIGSFWIGDGAICIYNKDTWFTCLPGTPDGGDLSPTKRFLTMPEIIEPQELLNRIKFIVVDDFSALFLMTNGVSDPKFENDSNLQYFEWWNKFRKDISGEIDFTGSKKNAGEKLLKWLDFWTPGKHDDRTIAVLF